MLDRRKRICKHGEGSNINGSLDWRWTENPRSGEEISIVYITYISYDVHALTGNHIINIFSYLVPKTVFLLWFVII